MKFRAIFIGFSCVALASNALANGRFPATNAILASAKDPNFLVLRATYGLLISHDRGGEWDWICESGVGYSGNEDPSLAITTNDNILAATFEGMFLSTDQACSWTSIMGTLNPGTTSRYFVDLTLGAKPNTVLTLANSYAGATDAGSTIFDSQTYLSNDNGVTWSPLGTKIDPTLLLETIDSAKSDANRIYISAATGTGNSRAGYLLTSNDAGKTWTPYPIPLDVANMEDAPYIAAVDPKHADRVYVRTSSYTGMGPTRLLVTNDGGRTFTVSFQAQGSLQGFALSPDGETAYLGSPNDGLYVTRTDSINWRKVSSIHVQCLTATSDTLYACSDEESGFAVGASHDQGATFAPLLHLCSYRGQLACPPSASTSQCSSQYGMLEDNLGMCAADGGPLVEDGGMDASTPPPVSTSSSSGGHGCDLTVLSQGARGGVLFAVGALIIALLPRRRRR